MSHTFYYHTRASSWGVAIWLTAEAVPLSAHDGEAEEIAEGVWVSIPDAVVSGEKASGEKYFMRLSNEEHAYLKMGMRLIAETIRSCAAARLPLIVRLQMLEFSLCDYQPEGLACAMAGWASAEFGFSLVPIAVSFDRPNNRYLFDFEPAGGGLP